MRDFEIRSPVEADTDPWLQANREMERALVAKQRAWNGLPYDEGAGLAENSWRENDSHLQALAARKGESRLVDTATVETLRLNAEDAVAAWRKNRDRAKREVVMLERLGESVPDDLRREADEPDQGMAIDEAAEVMRQRSKRTFARVLSGQS